MGNLLFMLLADLLINPEGHQHMYSCIPAEYSQNVFIFGLYFVSAFVVTGLFGCQMDYLVSHTLINWTDEIRYGVGHCL